MKGDCVKISTSSEHYLPHLRIMNGPFPNEVSRGYPPQRQTPRLNARHFLLVIFTVYIPLSRPLYFEFYLLTHHHSPPP